MSMQRIHDTFDHWLNGVPVIIPGFDGGFDAWINGIAYADRGTPSASSPSFSTTGEAVASVKLTALANLLSSGKGISTGSVAVQGFARGGLSGPGISLGSAQLTSLAPAFGAHGIGIAKARISLSSYPDLRIKGIGISKAAASLSHFILIAGGIGIAQPSASLSSFPALQARGIGRTTTSASIGYFMSVVIGPPIPGPSSMREAVPQFVSMFGFIFQPILDVLKTRYVPLNYVSPPICQPANSISSGSAFSIPMIV
jgi:hypothetical protein